jgi:Eukaryotic cytochrome b561
MDPKSTSANWIWAIKSGSAINSASTSASFNIHNSKGGFKLDLTSGTGGSSSNPFALAASNPSSATPSASSGASAPTASSTPSSGSSSVSSNTSQVRTAHATIMSLVFVVMFPAAALTIYLPYAGKVRHIHGPLQVLALILSIIGLALGVVLGQRVHKLDGYHQVIGYLVVGVLILFQPALGIMQHLHFTKTDGRSPMGMVHRWLGRTTMILGIINGGLGFMQSGPVGSLNVPSSSVVAYSIVASVVFVAYLAVLLATSFRAKHYARPRVGEKVTPPREHRGYQMQNSPQNNGRQLQSEPKRPNADTYTISNPNPGYGYGQG